MFQGQVPPFSTVSRLLLSPVGCIVVIFTPSVGFITNFLVKTWQGGISKFITCSLFIKINKFSHIVISLLPVIQDKERVMNFEIPPCHVLTKKFVIKPTESVKTTTTHPTRDNSSRDRLKMGAPALETCPVIKQGDVFKYSTHL